jgi:ABC-type Zn2+ transport system substrate-binding protein/surface adhesin
MNMYTNMYMYLYMYICTDDNRHENEQGHGLEHELEHYCEHEHKHEYVHGARTDFCRYHLTLLKGNITDMTMNNSNKLYSQLLPDRRGGQPEKLSLSVYTAGGPTPHSWPRGG